MKLKDLPKSIKKEEVCGLCNGKGYIQDKKGKDVHTCFKCLKAGRL